MEYNILCNMGKIEDSVTENKKLAEAYEKEGCHELAQAAREVADSFEKINNRIIADKQSVVR